MIDFIGIGAQKAGTSWTYACLYEHPEICMPIKEIHFFSRPRFEKGIAWYEAHFKKCAQGKRCGEFSTSYLYSETTAERIHTHYPDVKIVAIVRDPIARALSQYQNAIKGGEISETVSFESYYQTEPSVLEQGLYAKQLVRYFKYFDSAHILILVYEDARKDPRTFIQSIYAFLGVDAHFVPSMLHATINSSRVPRHVKIEKTMHYVSEFLRRHGFDALVHKIRQSGIPDLIRTCNTKQKKKKEPVFNRPYLVEYFTDDVKVLSEMLGRDLNAEWNMQRQ